MRRCLTAAFIVAAMSSPLTAFADNPQCPPGAWFCTDDAPANRDAQEPEEAAPPEEDSAEPPPQADALPPPPPPAPVPRATTRRGSQPPVVIYQPAPSSSPRTQIIIIAPGGSRPRVVHAPPRIVTVTRPALAIPPPPPAPGPIQIRRRWQSEWGLNLRLQGVGFGRAENASHDAGMGGFGLGLRYRPVPAFALEAGLDVIGGTDFNGMDRVELPFSLNGILYMNPRSRAQFYFTGGVNWSQATVKSDVADPRLSPDPDSDTFSTGYSYFGGQGGIGMEFRLSRRLSLNVDALAFVRSRTHAEDTAPEFSDPETGKSTNTSGGGLFRGGLTVWW